MEANVDRALLGASLAFAGATALGSVVALRNGLPGRPLGLSVPLSVPAGLLAGWGAGVAAPWPMPVAAVLAAVSARRPNATARVGAVCVAVGLLCIAGTVVEPVTHQPQSWSAATGIAIGVNLAASAVLIRAGLRQSVAARSHRRDAPA